MSVEMTIQDAMQGFLASLNALHTERSYGTALRHFQTYLAQRGIDVAQVPAGALSVDHAIDFVPWLRHEHFADPDQPAKATLQLYLTAVYRFYRSLLKRGVTFEAADIARLEETYRDARNIRGEPRPKDPKLAAVQAIVRAARSVPAVSGDKPSDRRRELARLRDIAIVETLRSTGCRVGELVSMRREDVDWLAHSALVKGKGSKYRKVYMDERAWMALKTYLQARGDEGESRMLARLPVFCGHGNRSGRTPSPLTTRHVSRIIQDLAERADLAEVGVTPHYFRHVFATRALDRTENLALVQDMLGHASPATTRVYARTDEKQRQEGYARVWGEGETERTFEHAIDALIVEEGPAIGGSADLVSPADDELSVLTSAVAESLLNAAHAQWAEEGADDGTGEWGARLQEALIALLVSTGASLEELIALRLRDIDPSSRGVHVRPVRHVLARGRTRLFHLGDRAWSALDCYLALRMQDDRVPGALFCQADGTSLSLERAYDLLATVAARAGVGEKGLQRLL